MRLDGSGLMIFRGGSLISEISSVGSIFWRVSGLPFTLSLPCTKYFDLAFDERYFTLLSSLSARTIEGLASQSPHTPLRLGFA